MRYFFKIVFSLLFILPVLFVHAGVDEAAKQLLLNYIDNLEDTNLITIKKHLEDNPGLENALLDDRRDRNNQITPLIYAIRYTQNTDLLKLLVKAGADVNRAAPDGKTPLITALLLNSTGCKDCVKFLCQEGAFAVNMLFAKEEEEKRKRVMDSLTFQELEMYTMAKFADEREQEWEEKKRQIAEKIDEKYKLEIEDIEQDKRRRQEEIKSISHSVEYEIKREKIKALEEIVQALKKEVGQNKDEIDLATKPGAMSIENFYDELQEQTTDQWLAITKTPFVQQLLRQQEQAENKTFTDILKKQVVMSLIIYNTLHIKSKNVHLNAATKALVELTKETVPSWEDIFYALEFGEDDIDPFFLRDRRDRQICAFLRTDKELNDYREKILASALSLPDEVQIIAHIFVWIGGDVSNSNNMGSWLKKWGLKDKQISLFNFNAEKVQKLSYLLKYLIENIKKDYPMATGDFIRLVKSVYAVKAKLLTKIVE